MAHITDIESSRIFKSAGRAYPSHHAHFFFSDLLILFLFLLLHLLHNLFFDEFIDIPTIDQNETITLLEEDIKRRAKYFSFVLLEDIYEFTGKSWTIEVLGYICDMKDSFPLRRRWRRIGNQRSKLLCFDEMVKLFEDTE